MIWRLFKSCLAVFAVMSLLVIGGSQVASAASWGPATSTYNGSVVVEGSGTMTRLTTGSRSYVAVKDRKADGNTVYGYTNVFRITETCTSFGFSKIITGSSSSCKINSTPIARYSTPETTSTTSRTWERPWCDQNGNNCSNYGQKVVAGACAQMGFPVPNSCTYAVVEFHRP